MLSFLSLFSILAILGVIVAKPHPRTRIPSMQNAGTCANTRSGAKPRFRLQDLYSGQDFFSYWDFFTDPDPTHGMVTFLGREEAAKSRLAFVENDTVVLAVDDFTDVVAGGKRDSVRIQTRKSFNGGLFVADFLKMPHGCSIWPAWWSVGPHWPAGGEIDILEGVHEGPTNTFTLHTTPGCTITETEDTTSLLTPRSSNCDSSPGTDHLGCSFTDKDEASYGHQFNLRGGGVFAHLWDDTGIKVWRFPRDSIPPDVHAKEPIPSTWGTPHAYFPSTTCNVTKHFFDHVLVLDTTICGDLGNPTFQSAGCPGICSDSVSVKENFKFAKWVINYIAVYVHGA